MQLIVGLGNPGVKYINTRHNVGFIVLDALASKFDSNRWSVNSKFKSTLCRVKNSVLLAKPQTFMNDSGAAVSSLASFYKIPPNKIYVVHDDLDIKLGDYKIQKGVGPKVHNGINSINQALGAEDYWRIRVGIENRDKDHRTIGEEYVLESFSSEEKKIVNNVIERIVKDLIEKFQKGMDYE